jgi:hypothetical protein
MKEYDMPGGIQTHHYKWFEINNLKYSVKEAPQSNTVILIAFRGAHSIITSIIHLPKM